MIFFLESSKTAFSNVDPPPLRSETEAHVERYGLRSQLQHSRKGVRILRGVDSIARQVLGRQLEPPRPLEGGHLPMAWDSNRVGIRELGVSRCELRQILNRGHDGGDRLTLLASDVKALHTPGHD